TGSTAPAAALVITTLAAPNAQLNAPYNLQLQSIGGTGTLTWSLSSGALPPGLSLTAAGLISGTPAAVGTFNFNINVTDSGTPQQNATRPLTIVVSTQPPFTVAQIQPPGATAGLPFTYTPSATGGSTPYTWMFKGALPPGLTVAPGTGVITGTPTTAGTYSGYYVAVDSSMPIQSGLLPITIIVSTWSMTFSTQPSNGTVGQPLPPVGVTI